MAISALALTLALSAGACGEGEGDPDATGAADKAGYIEQGDRECRKVLRRDASVRRKLAELAQPQVRGTARYLRDGARLQAERSRLFSSLADRLRELSAPAADRSALEKYLAGVEQVANLQSRLAQLAQVGDRAQYDALATELSPISSRTGGIATGYGFKVCGSG